MSDNNCVYIIVTFGFTCVLRPRKKEREKDREKEREKRTQCSKVGRIKRERPASCAILCLNFFVCFPCHLTRGDKEVTELSGNLCLSLRDQVVDVGVPRREGRALIIRVITFHVMQSVPTLHQR